jgi:tryptophanyl-tRNA synthetase
LAVAAYFLAFGLDPNKAALFRQSDVPEVTEMAWFLSSVYNIGSLERAHSYKAAKDLGNANELNHATFMYPVLMAADILIYNSDVVPVGSDQVQHLEMTRDMASRFNAVYGDLLKLPEAIVNENVATVPGTDGRKMSKSYQNTIEPLTTSKKLKKQIMSIVTDVKSLEEPKDPTTCNVFALYKLFATKSEIETMRSNYLGGNYGYGHAKVALYEKMDAYFTPFREKYMTLIENPERIEEALAIGSQRVRPVVNETMEKLRFAVGVGRRKH